MIIALTGDRLVGKSEVARHLVNNQGFVRVHPFDGGKAMCKAYYKHIGFDEETSERMINGDLKDTNMEALPFGQSSRYLMEEIGKFIPTLGLEWTLGAEIERVRRIYGEIDMVIESLVYEEAVVRAYPNNIIVKIERNSSMIGAHSSRAVQTVIPDITVENNGSLDTLFAFFDGIVQAERAKYVHHNG